MNVSTAVESSHNNQSEIIASVQYRMPIITNALKNVYFSEHFITRLTNQTQRLGTRGAWIATTVPKPGSLERIVRPRHREPPSKTHCFMCASASPLIFRINDNCSCCDSSEASRCNCCWMYRLCSIQHGIHMNFNFCSPNIIANVSVPPVQGCPPQYWQRASRNAAEKSLASDEPPS